MEDVCCNAPASILYREIGGKAQRNWRSCRSLYCSLSRQLSSDANKRTGKTHEMFHCCVRQQRFESPPAHVLHFQRYLFAGFAGHCLRVRAQATAGTHAKMNILSIPLSFGVYARTRRKNVMDNGPKCVLGLNDFVQSIVPCRFVAGCGAMQASTPTNSPV